MTLGFSNCTKNVTKILQDIGGVWIIITRDLSFAVKKNFRLKIAPLITWYEYNACHGRRSLSLLKAIYLSAVYRADSVFVFSVSTYFYFRNGKRNYG